MFKAVQEINKELTKNKEGFFLDFVDEAYIYLRNKHYFIRKKKNVTVMKMKLLIKM